MAAAELHSDDGPPSKERDGRSDVAPVDCVSRGDLVGGKYELVRKLSSGGMGSLWIAYNVRLDVRVAVKLIRADVKGQGDARLADRLLQEARACAQLDHSAIVSILDFGKTAKGDPYIVMELLEGEDLGMALERRGRVSPMRAVQTLLPIAHGLCVAHDKGIVHRDIKPENVFLAEAENRSLQPKLIDFGVAKLERDRTERLTNIGAMLGSPGYMSPEQAVGEDVDHRADCWALCVVLYEMVTGHKPFQGRNCNALLRAIIEDSVTPTTELGVGDDELWAILCKGLAKDVEQRWGSMRSLGHALASWLLARGAKQDTCGSSLEAMWLREPGSVSADVLASVAPPAAVLAEAPAAVSHRAPAVIQPPSPAARLRWSPSLMVRLTLILLAVLAVAGVGLVVWHLAVASQPGPEAPKGRVLG